MQEYCLINAFSPKLTKLTDTAIREQGVHLYTSTKVTEITGTDGKATGVKLSNGIEIPAELVIQSIGYNPNTKLAENAGLEINSKHANPAG